LRRDAQLDIRLWRMSSATPDLYGLPSYSVGASYIGRYYLVKPKFHLLRHVTTRHARRVMCIVTCLFQHGGRRRNSSAQCTSLLFCALDYSINLRNNFWKKWGGHVYPSPRSGDDPEHVSCESRLSRLSWQACRSVLSDKRDTFRHIASRHVTICPCAKMHGLDSVSWRDVRSQMEFGLNSGMCVRGSPRAVGVPGSAVREKQIVW